MKNHSGSQNWSENPRVFFFGSLPKTGEQRQVGLCEKLLILLRRHDQSGFSSPAPLDRASHSLGSLIFVTQRNFQTFSLCTSKENYFNQAPCRFERWRQPHQSFRRGMWCLRWSFLSSSADMTGRWWPTQDRQTIYLPFRERRWLPQGMPRSGHSCGQHWQLHDGWVTGWLIEG